MKHLIVPYLLFFIATCGRLSAQEAVKTDTLPTPEAQKSEYLLFGRHRKPAHHPVTPPKNHVVLKMDLVAIAQKGVGLEAEKPVGPWMSLVFRSGWQKVNPDIPYRTTGTYEQIYETTYSEAFRFLHSPNANIQTTYSPAGYEDVGEFLPSSLIPFQASIRTYIGKERRISRFFIQPGIKMLLVKGFHIADEKTLLSTTTGSYYEFAGTAEIYVKSTTYSYRQTRIVGPEPIKAIGGLTLDLGWRLQAKGRMTCDLGVRTGWNDAKGIFGLQKVYFLPALNFGIRI